MRPCDGTWSASFGVFVTARRLIPVVGSAVWFDRIIEVLVGLSFDPFRGRGAPTTQEERSSGPVTDQSMMSNTVCRAGDSN